MTVDLVAATRHGVCLGRSEAEKDVTSRILLPAQSRPGGIEASGAVVQQRRVSTAGQQPDCGIGFVPRGRDRVVALVLGLEPARCEIEMPALELGIEQRPQLRGALDVQVTKACGCDLLH